jgi:hypothetical protein
MDGTAVASQLIALGQTPDSNAVRFEVASTGHDAALRHLLRENPMPGQISLSLEREPSYFSAAAIEGPEHQTIIATEGNRVLCAGSISSRLRFINGAPLRVGYLGGLRMDASCRGRTSVIRRGYELFRQLHEKDGPPIYLTSIIADNLAARRLLERGLKGMPTYRFLGEFVTLVIRRRHRGDFYKPTGLVRRRLREKGLRLVYGSDQQTVDIVDLLNRDHQQYQFGPVWSANELQPQEFRIAYSQEGMPVACAAIWDQRAIKQTVVRGYSNRMRWTRPLINLGAALLGRPRLPRVGQAIQHAFVSQLAVSAAQPKIAEWLILLLHGLAHTRKIDYLTIGFDARDPRLAHLRKVFRPREYISRLYTVFWDDGAELARGLDDRLLAPEVGLL